MSFNGFINIEELLKTCGYNNDSFNNQSYDTNYNSNNDNHGCNDIPNGFQSLPPELVAIIGEILGNIIAGTIPFNLQNLIGNWLELVGQVILVFNAQQQYFQGGPGRYFDPKNYNINNPFCTNDEDSSSEPENSNTSSFATTSKSNNNNNNNNNNSNNNKNNNTSNLSIENLKKQVEELSNELNEIKMLLKTK